MGVLDTDQARKRWPHASFGRGCTIGDDVAIHGNVQVGKNVSICGPAEINGTGSKVVIGDGCDIASYVVINVADSHRKCVGHADLVIRREIFIGPRTFVGTMSVVMGGATIREGCVIGAMTRVESRAYRQRSLIVGNPGVVVREPYP